MYAIYKQAFNKQDFNCSIICVRTFVRSFIKLALLFDYLKLFSYVHPCLNYIIQRCIYITNSCSLKNHMCLLDMCTDNPVPEPMVYINYNTIILLTLLVLVLMVVLIHVLIGELVAFCSMYIKYNKIHM